MLEKLVPLHHMFSLLFLLRLSAVVILTGRIPRRPEAFQILLLIRFLFLTERYEIVDLAQGNIIKAKQDDTCTVSWSGAV